MKLNLKWAIGAAACAVAFCASNAGAQITSNGANDEDIIVAFKDNTQSNALYVDLGNFGSIAATTNISADLTSLFGSGWATDNTLVWTVLGANDFGSDVNTDTLWIGDKNSTALSPVAESVQGTVVTDIEAIYNDSQNGTQGSNDNAWLWQKAGAGSYGSAYADLSASWANTQQTGDIGSGSDSSNLWQLEPTASGESAASAKDIGTVTLASNGELTYAAVPEPSTWASIAVGALALVGFRRRRA